ncbi:major facilitator transporter [Sulfobacillus acidophilus TPY]|uniref:Major facilitator superfamily MFS_1 n=1 Tax=Sulfobacillus acidophilus (strain ATCC 700253 / DSM 10332 / NAL) TaxID=679936 RepID=G8TVS2_SULAD|nr:major facilitator transporter [Sulfobacillus acidophilus TPY]AEW04766.1 major facilitator superfamily MFS_1 [Sulfobacillus acidophilus DSM 10332]
MTIPEPRDTISPWAAISLFLAAFVVFANLYDVQPLLPMFRQVFHAREASVSLSLGLTVLGIAAASVVVGPLSDRVGRKNLMVIATLLLGIPTLLATFSHRLALFLVWRTLTGLLIPGIIAVVIAYVNEEYRPPASHLLMGLYVGSTVMGGLVGRMGTGVLTALWGWRPAFWVIAAFTEITGLWLWRFLPPSRRFRPDPSWHRAFRNLAASFRHPGLLALGFLGFCYFFAFISSFTFLTYDLAGPPFRLSQLAIGLVFFTYIFGVVASPLAGRASSRFGPFEVIGVGLTLVMVGMPITLIPHLPIILIGLSLITFGQFTAQAITPGLAGQIAPHGRGAAGGVYTVFYYIGGSLGAAIPGMLWSRYRYPGVIAVNEVFLFGAFAVWLWARRQLKAG